MKIKKEYFQYFIEAGQKQVYQPSDIIYMQEDDADLIYFDPPYCNSHADYQSFYHVLETYTNYWHNNEKIYKNSTKRYYPKKYSGFDTKKDIILSFKKMFNLADKIPYWIISYNDRSYPTKEILLELTKQYRNVTIQTKKYSNSVGGKGSVKGSQEILFICQPK